MITLCHYKLFYITNGVDNRSISVQLANVVSTLHCCTEYDNKSSGYFQALGVGVLAIKRIIIIKCIAVAASIV